MYCANKNRGGEYWFKSSPWLQQFNSNKKNVIIWPTTYAVSIIVIAAINLASDKISIIACTWLLIYYCSCMQTITRWGWWWCTAGPQGASIPSDPRNKSLTRLGKSANATAICKKSKRACAAHGPGRCGVRGVHARAFHILLCVSGAAVALAAPATSDVSSGPPLACAAGLASCCPACEATYSS